MCFKKAVIYVWRAVKATCLSVSLYMCLSVYVYVYLCSVVSKSNHPWSQSKHAAKVFSTQIPRKCDHSWRINILGDWRACSWYVCYVTGSFRAVSCDIWYVEGRHRHILYFERLILCHVVCFHCNITGKSELEPGNPTMRTRLQRRSQQTALMLTAANQTDLELSESGFFFS